MTAALLPSKLNLGHSQTLGGGAPRAGWGTGAAQVLSPEVPAEARHRDEHILKALGNLGIEGEPGLHQ
jgi:hypothetical protein